MKKLFLLFTVATVVYRIAKRLGYMDNHPKTRYVMDKLSDNTLEKQNK